MATQFTPCPACGAVGEVGSNCQFCGTAIILKEGTTLSNARIVKQRTITPQQYAEKISIYHSVEKSPSSKLMYVSIGDEIGIINLNAEIVYPLQHEYELNIISDIILMLTDFENLIITEYGRKIYLSKFLNLETLEIYDGIECNDSQTKFYAWESFRCKGMIDPITWNIISPPSGQRIPLAMSEEKYEEFAKKAADAQKAADAKKAADAQKAADAKKAADAQKAADALSTKKKIKQKIYKITFLITGILILMAYIIYEILQLPLSDPLGELLFTLFYGCVGGALVVPTIGLLITDSR
ncbi:MAG: hypothetical protein UH685_02705 [Bacteroidaceae bacterium]|nr:hypothetical protein [Bacteroidaceae bacterium]